MKYISIDIETTGLDPEKHQILEFAAAYDDLENPVPIEQLPTFVRRIYWDDLVINRYCLKLHRGLLKEIAEDHADLYETSCGNIVTTIDQLSGHFMTWLSLIGVRKNYNVAGKNFAGFDGLFLKKVPGFPPWFYRVIDVGSMFLTREMSKIPGLGKIVEGEPEHRALPDALAVVKAIRQKLLPKANQGYGHGLSTV